MFEEKVFFDQLVLRKTFKEWKKLKDFLKAPILSFQGNKSNCIHKSAGVEEKAVQGDLNMGKDEKFSLVARP